MTYPALLLTASRVLAHTSSAECTSCSELTKLKAEHATLLFRFAEKDRSFDVLMHELRTAWLARDQAEKETKRLLGTINNTPDSSDAGTLLNDDGPSLYPLHDVHNVPIARARRSTILIPPTLLTCRSSPPNYGAGNGDIALTRLRQAMNICLDASTRALETERALRTDLEHELSLYRSKIINIQTRPASLGPDFSAVRTTAKLCSFNFTKRLRKRKLYNQPNWKSLTVKRYFLVSDRKTEVSSGEE